jgi:hypothetical protein
VAAHAELVEGLSDGGLRVVLKLDILRFDTDASKMRFGPRVERYIKSQLDL